MDAESLSPEQLAVLGAMAAVEAMVEAGYNADLSLASLKEVDRLIDEHSEHGRPIANGYFEPAHLPEHTRTTMRLYALGCYVGAVLKQQYGGEWHAESNQTEAVDSLRLSLPCGWKANPIGKVFKRMENGLEDSLEFFGLAIAMLGSAKEGGDDATD